jgi:hypothetical protein
MRLLLLLALAPSVLADDSVPRARLGSIDGGASVIVVNGKERREAKGGDALKRGDRIETGEKITATVLSPEGSVLVVGRKTEVEVQSAPEAVSAVELRSGTLRGIAGKVPKYEKGTQPKKFRILIRSRAAVMGVRGTDFVMAADAAAGQAQVNTLEGVVEVAKDEATLVTQGGTPVPGGQMVSATPGGGLSAPAPFDRAQFAEQMRASQPTLEVPAFEPKAPGGSEPAPEPSPTPPPVEETKKKDDDGERSRTSLMSFQGYYVSNELVEGHSSSGSLIEGKARGPGLSWNPTIALLGQWLAVRGHFGLYKFSTDALGSVTTTAVNLGGLVSFRILGHFLFELGPMSERWEGYSYQGAAVVLGWEFGGTGLLGLIDRVFVSGGGGDAKEPGRSPFGSYKGGRFGLGVRF